MMFFINFLLGLTSVSFVFSCFFILIFLMEMGVCKEETKLAGRLALGWSLSTAIFYKWGSALLPSWPHVGTDDSSAALAVFSAFLLCLFIMAMIQVSSQRSSRDNESPIPKPLLITIEKEEA